jgi:hypothetical protein
VSLRYQSTNDIGTSFDVLSGELRIGHISKGAMSLAASREEPWSWGFALHVAPPGFVMHGSAATLEEAQEAMERNWALWLTVAGLREG